MPLKGNAVARPDSKPGKPVAVTETPHSTSSGEPARDTMLYNGKWYQTQLYNFKFIDSLKDRDGNIYFIMAGTDCTECDENISIYIRSPYATVENVNEQSRYSYPGKERDYETGKLISETRMFYGSCLDNSACVVWTQKYRDDKGKSTKDMFVLRPEKGSLVEMRIPYSDSILALLKKNCRELAGSEMSSEP